MTRDGRGSRLRQSCCLGLLLVVLDIASLVISRRAKKCRTHVSPDRNVRNMVLLCGREGLNGRSCAANP